MGLGLEGMFFLKGHIISKTNGGEGDKAVVVGLEEGPILIVGECGSPNAKGADAGEESNGDHIGHRYFWPSHAKALLDAVQEVPHKGVDPFAQTLKHDQSEWDSQQGIEHTKDFPTISARGCMSIACGTKKQSKGNLVSSTS